jgi:RNAse (barnase) inhibitor barstar
MSKTFLYQTQKAAFHLAVTSPSEITNFCWSLVADPVRVVVRFLRGKKMTRTDELHNEVAAALQFPWYYGENWAAFDECINDLDWMPADFYFLIITEAEELLSKEEDGELSVFLQILQKAAIEWSGEAESLDEPKRSPASFCVVFQANDHASVKFADRLQLMGVPYQDLKVETN